MNEAEIETVINQQDFFLGLEPDHTRFLATCAVTQHFSAERTLFRHDARANRFYLLQSGRVSIEVAAISGPPLELQELGAGDVIGWSWLIPPYRWHFQARATEECEVIEFDGEAILEHCEQEPAFGYELFKRFSGLMSRRISHAREKMMDEWRPAGIA